MRNDKPPKHATRDRGTENEHEERFATLSAFSPKFQFSNLPALVVRRAVDPPAFSLFRSLPPCQSMEKCSL